MSMTSASQFLKSPLPLSLSRHRRSPPSSTARFPSVIAAANASAERTKATGSYNTCFSGPNLASSTFSLYETLGISMGASSQEIKAAYRTLARNCHPDVVTVCRKESSADEFMKIHAAYSTLSDPQKRAEYDRRLFRLHRSYTPAVSAAPESVFSRYTNSYTSRNWETDQCW